MDTYDTLPGIRRSDLWEIRKTPEIFWHNLTHPQEQTPALKFGSVVHTAILEPSLFDERYAVAPNVDRRTTTGKMAWNDFCEGIAGREVISQDDYMKAMLMQTAILRNKSAMEILTEDGFRERVYRWTDPETGEKLKCKCDIVIPEWEGRALIVDYKTTGSCADGDFERSCRKYGYDFQAAFYSAGFFAVEYEEPRFAFIAQEKDEPYSARVYFCDPYFVEQGRTKFRSLLQIYHQCKKRNEWPGYPDTELLGE